MRRHCAQKLNRKHNVTYMHMPRLRAYELRVLHPIRFEYATHNLSAMHTRCIAKCSHKRMRIILRSTVVYRSCRTNGCTHVFSTTNACCSSHYYSYLFLLFFAKSVGADTDVLGPPLITGDPPKPCYATESMFSS